MTKHNSYLTIEEMVAMPLLHGVHMSEDGQSVLVNKQVADFEANTYNNEIWIWRRGEGAARMLDVKDASGAAWSPNGKQMAYLLNGQIFVTDFKTTRQLTDPAVGVTSFKWSACGTRIYFITQGQEVGAVVEGVAVEFVDEVVVTNQLCYVSLEEDEVEVVSDALHFIFDFDVSADGETIALIVGPSPSMKDYRNRDIYVKYGTSADLVPLQLGKFLEGGVLISPDGKSICFAASIEQASTYEFRIPLFTLEVLDLVTGGITQPLKPHDSSLLPVRWTERGIVVCFQDQTNYRLGIVTTDGSMEPLVTERDGFITAAFVTRDGLRSAYLFAKPNETFELYVDDEKMTNENGVFNRRSRAVRELYEWKSSDGTLIEGVLTKPVEIDSGKSYPLLIVAHGGPAWAAFPFFSNCYNGKYPIEQFIENGYLVLEPNYKGSSGYGNDFLQANFKKLGHAYYEDIASGIDALANEGMIDPTCVGILGWSNGGYVAAFCANVSDRFQVASVGGGITNWHSHYVHTDIPYSMDMHFGSTPYDDSMLYTELSPVTYVTKAKTPTLIQHGDADVRVPVTNAYELFRGLKNNGVVTKLAIYKGMAYDAPNPKTSVHIMHENLAWVKTYLGKVQGKEATV